jgi:S-layer protein
MTTVDYTTNITAWVQAIQFQNPTQATINAFNAILNSDGLTPTPAQFATLSQQVVAQIEADPYTVNNVNPVIEIYQAAYGRVPDQAGLKFWVQAVAANPAAIATLATTFANAPEFAARYGAGVNATTPASPSLVISLYTNVLQRAPDANGLAFWESQNLNAAQLLQDFALSPEFVNDVSSLGVGQQPSYVQAFQTLEALGVPPTSGSLFNVTATNAFTLTTGADTFTAIGKGAVFTASPVQFAPALGGTGILVNTLNTGDKLADPYNDGVLNDNIVGATLGGVLGAGFGTQPPFATGVSISGISTVNFNNQAATTSGQAPAFGALGGFEGLGGIATSVTGITTVNNNNSIAPVQIGGVNAFGLGTVLQNYNSNNSDNNFAAFISAGAFGATPQTIAINLVGNMGLANTVVNGKGIYTNSVGPVVGFGGAAATVNGRVDFLTFAPDSGTAGYSTWTINSNSTGDYLALGEGSVSPVASGIGTGAGSATKLVLTGSANYELSSSSGVFTGGQAGDWASLTTIDASKATGTVVITGGQANATGGYVNANGAQFGLLSGNNGTTPLTILGGKGTTFVDLSTSTLDLAGEVINVAAGNTSLQNTLILSPTVVNQPLALPGESGYQIIGYGGQLPVGVTSNPMITMNNFPGSPAAAGSGQGGASELKLYAYQTSGGVLVNVTGPSTTTIGLGVTSVAPFTVDFSGDTGFIPDATTLGTVAVPPFTAPITPFAPFGTAKDAWNIVAPTVPNQGPGNLTLDFGSDLGPAGGTVVGTGTGTGVVFNPLGAGVGFATIATAFDAIDALTTKGYSNISIVSGGPGSAHFGLGYNEISSIVVTQNPGQIIDLNFSGTSSLDIGTGPIGMDQLAGPLPFQAGPAFGTGVITLGVDGGAIVDTISGQLAFGVTNATAIDAHLSGGIFQSGNDTATGGTNIQGSLTSWNNIEGAAGGAPSTLGGGNGYDTLPWSAGDAGHGDIFVTNGGTGTTKGDTVNLFAGHSNTNHVDIYVAASGTGTPASQAPIFTGLPDYVAAVTVDSTISTITTLGNTPVAGFEFAGAGFWGQTAGGAFNIMGTASGFGTSASQVIVNNFNPTGANHDVITFSVHAWAVGAGISLGLQDITGAAHPASSLLGTNAVLSDPVVGSGGVVTGTAVGGVNPDVIVLVGNYANAAAVAASLHTPAGNIFVPDPGAPGASEHFLIAYSDGTNAHIADLQVTIPFPIPANTALTHIAVSDLVQLTGVSLSSLTGADIHFVA